MMQNLCMTLSDIIEKQTRYLYEDIMTFNPLLALKGRPRLTVISMINNAIEEKTERTH